LSISATPNVVTDPVGTANLLLYTGPASAAGAGGTGVDVPPTTAPVETTPPTTPAPTTPAPPTAVPEPVATTPTTTVPVRNAAPTNAEGASTVNAAPQVTVVKRSVDKVTLRISGKGKVDIYRNGKYLLTTTKKLVTLKMKQIKKSSFTVKAFRARS
jgi:hypothetical protein